MYIWLVLPFVYFTSTSSNCSSVVSVVPFGIHSLCATCSLVCCWHLFSHFSPSPLVQSQEYVVGVASVMYVFEAQWFCTVCTCSKSQVRRQCRPRPVRPPLTKRRPSRTQFQPPGYHGSVTSTAVQLPPHFLCMQLARLTSGPSC